VRGNTIHRITSNGYGGWGVYLDEGSSGILVESNLTWQTKSGGIHIHYGRDNLVRNNVFSFAMEAQVQRTRVESVRCWTFVDNIVIHDRGPTIGCSHETAVFDRNIYWRVAGRTRFSNLSFEQWKALGQDGQGIVADPLVSGLEVGRPVFRPDSPALARGFRPVEEMPPRDVPAIELRLELGAAAEFASTARAGSPHQHTATNQLVQQDARPVCVLVKNHGAAPVRGEIVLRADPPDAAAVDRDILHYSLQPGEQASLDAAVTPRPGVKQFAVEAAGENLLVPSVLYFNVA
jgi:hypothetical protein